VADVTTGIPAAAVTAAAHAINAGLPAGLTLDESPARRAAERALEAAWPHLLAAAGKLITEDDCRRIMQETIDARGGEIEKAARASERERLFTAIRHKIPLSEPWRGKALDLIYEAWRDTDG
jgi:hypothetical protein